MFQKHTLLFYKTAIEYMLAVGSCHELKFDYYYLLSSETLRC